MSDQKMKPFTYLEHLKLEDKAHRRLLRIEELEVELRAKTRKIKDLGKKIQALEGLRARPKKPPLFTLTQHAKERLNERWERVMGRPVGDESACVRAMIARAMPDKKISTARRTKRLISNRFVGCEYLVTPDGWRLVMKGSEILTIEHQKPGLNHP